MENREILFKGKRLDNGEWVKGFLVKTESNQAYIFHAWFIPVLSVPSKWYTEIDTETVCQYTGRQDKNGVKIFEGDILSEDDSCNYTVYWNEPLCSFLASGDQGDKYGAYNLSLSTNSEYSKKELKKYSITGNIHDKE